MRTYQNSVFTEAIKWWNTISFSEKCTLIIKHIGTDHLIDKGADRMSDEKILFLYQQDQKEERLK